MDILTTTSINNLISTYQKSESNKLISPLTNRKTRYSNQSASYTALISKITALKASLTSLTKTGTESIFSSRQAASSNTNLLTASAGSTAVPGSYELLIKQLAKKDVAVSNSFNSGDANLITGTHKFKVITGDGDGGEFESNVEVEFSGSETNKTAIEKIQSAINSDKAVITSSSKTGADSYIGGAASFTINLNGTETVISVDGSAATYEELLDSVVAEISTNISGVEAGKIEDPSTPGNFRLSITVKDSSNYISISNDSGFDLASDLNINVTKEKAASAVLTVSSFYPLQGQAQLTLSSKNSGLNYRIKELSDGDGFTALSSIGLNLGSSRPAFDQDANTSGFIYSDITSSGNLLNSKFNFNGLEVQRDSNVVTDIAEGLTLNLKSSMSITDTPVNIDVSNDVSQMKSVVEDFIKKYNDVYTYIKSHNTYSSGVRGNFYGDSNSQTLLGYLSSMASGQTEGINTLNKIGITFNSSIGLTLSDSTLFETNINESLEETAAIFNSEEGIAANLLSEITPYIGSSGYLTLFKTTLDNNIKSANDKIKSVETRISKSAANLRRRYEQLQAQLAVLLSTQSYFSGSSY